MSHLDLTPYADDALPAATTQPVPTQVKHKWRAMARTAVAIAIGFLPLVPEALAGLHLDGTAFGVQLTSAAVTVTGILALPAVEDFLQRWVPWLSAQPAPWHPSSN